MIVLDTNVISEYMREAPNSDAVLWLDSQPRMSVWTTSINVYEIRSGLLAMPVGKRRSAMIAIFERVLTNTIQGRVAFFDLAAADCASDLAATRKAKGTPVEARDTMIAGIVLANRATLATRNVRHFADIAGSVVNPWEA